MVIDDGLIPIIDEMYAELSMEQLEVCLVPGTHPDHDRMIRATTGQNPQWYQELCQSYPCMRAKKRNPRKDYTKVKRQYILKVLERMIRNKNSRSEYAHFIVTEAVSRKELFDKYEKDGLVPWNDQF